jgi:hypothetical protein
MGCCHTNISYLSIKASGHIGHHQVIIEEIHKWRQVTYKLGGKKVTYYIVFDTAYLTYAGVILPPNTVISNSECNKQLFLETVIKGRVFNLNHSCVKNSRNI